MVVRHLLRPAGRADRQGLRSALPEFLAERVFEPLGMADTGFVVPAGKLERFTGYYRTGPTGSLDLADGPDGPPPPCTQNSHSGATPKGRPMIKLPRKAADLASNSAGDHSGG